MWWHLWRWLCCRSTPKSGSERILKIVRHLAEVMCKNLLESCWLVAQFFVPPCICISSQIAVSVPRLERGRSVRQTEWYATFRTTRLILFLVTGCLPRTSWICRYIALFASSRVCWLVVAFSDLAKVGDRWKLKLPVTDGLVTVFKNYAFAWCLNIFSFWYNVICRMALLLNSPDILKTVVSAYSAILWNRWTDVDSYPGDRTLRCC